MLSFKNESGLFIIYKLIKSFLKLSNIKSLKPFSNFKPSSFILSNFILEKNNSFALLFNSYKYWPTYILAPKSFNKSETTVIFRFNEFSIKLLRIFEKL